MIAISDTKTILSRFPHFELSYETISHKKVSEPYDVALAIPMGKKYYLWFSFDGKNNACYLMEIMRDKRIGTIVKIPILFHHSLSLGTVLYGTLVSTDSLRELAENTSSYEENAALVSHSDVLPKIFVVEDIFYYKGISIKHHTFSEKLGAIHNMFSKKFVENNNNMALMLPCLWTENIFDDIHNKARIEKCGYTVHHIQYRSLVQIIPYINMSAKPKTALSEMQSSIQIQEPTFYGIVPPMCFSKPQYKCNTTFVVRADIQFDIYHLFAYGVNKTQVYCGLACIPNYKKSVFMNELFRNIRENRNLDYIEESDNEEDFEDTRLDKYVDSEKTLLMECVFHKKFKKWIPEKVAPTGQQVVHIQKL